jgi:ferric-dicitrate binding protein FerR (iron transport regulator)
VKLAETNPNELSWKTKKLVFDNSDLNAVLEDVSELYEKEFEYNRKSNSDCTFSGQFNDASLSDITETLSYSLGLTFKEEGNKIIVSGSSCN